MKILLVVTALTCLAQTFAQQWSQPTCLEGSSWFDGCNQCRCIRGGAACSKKACPPFLRGKQLLEGNPACTDGSRWLKDNCNWCDCIDGAAVCTLKFCLNGDSDSVAETTQISEAEEPSSDDPLCKGTDATNRWREGCNWCSCGETGVPRCTRRGCPSLIVQRLEGTKECEGEPSWRRDCNWCHCENQTAVCTEIHCPADDSPVAPSPPSAEGRAPDAVCETGLEGRWRHRCNWCSCAADGTVSRCTKRGCPPGLQNRLEGTPECEGSAVWKRDCNWCSCVDGVPVCTEMACGGADENPGHSQVSTTDDSECLEGSRWTESCNQCFCAEGHGACTLRGCLREVEDTCELGAVWRHDSCNWCTCPNGRPSCTKKACTHPHTRPTPEAPLTDAAEATPSVRGDGASCTSGSRWKQDKCNWCNCVDGHGVCTVMACVSRSRAGNDAAKELECIHGSSWSDGCNQCACSNGHSICTLRACLNDATPIRGAAVAPDMSRPQVQDRPRGHAVAPDMSRPQVQDRPRGHAVAPDMSRPQVQDRPRPSIHLPRDDRDCVPGSRFKLDGCNWCSCTETGIAACTLMACLRSGHNSDEKMCEEGSRWKKGCNWCNCVQGKGFCTTMICLPDSLKGRSPPPEEELSDDAECSANARWKKDCNWCTCREGKGTCTRKLCRQGVLDPHANECDQGSRWKESCNWCQCTEKGTALCTVKGCLAPAVHPVAARMGAVNAPEEEEEEDDDDEKQCNPGARFRQQCNWCTCSETGVKLCPRMACLPGKENVDEPECEGDATFKDEDNCNWCFCNQGYKVCTRRACFSLATASAVSGVRHQVQAASHSAHSSEIDSDTDSDSGSESDSVDTDDDVAECESDTNWEEDCNRCMCVDGRKACTRRLCFHAPEVSREPKSRAVDRCSKQAESGPCFASFRMFRFNSEANRCEPFLYGGCMGNDNRFSTPELCHKTCGGEAPVIDASCDRKQCPEFRQNAFYAAKECRPIFQGGECCPSSYECPGEDEPLFEKNGLCFFRGRQYNIDHDISMPSDPCSKCKCVQAASGAGKIMCTTDEWCRDTPSRTQNCHSLYNIDQCCEVDFVCEDPDSAGKNVTQSENDVTCDFDDYVFKNGTRIYPENDSCQLCICGPDFAGPYGPGCRAVECGYDFRYSDKIRDGCVPLYYKKRCCPVTFLCPGEDQNSVASDQSDANPDGLVDGLCKFGSIEVAPGRNLVITEAVNFSCTCTTPPSLTCIQNIT